MLPQEIIRKKREGGTLDEAEIAFMVEGLTKGTVTEGQVAAFAMAVFFRGMALSERVALTRAMRDSGTVLAWDLPGPVLDKHSSGGVGDNVSLMLAPMVAACGGYVPMISGRGLGHTGGTLDKLDAIPGYRTQPDNALFATVVREVGCAIIGQTADLAPADKRFYAIRDVTATVESIDLITASILSKKLAAGLEGLVLDVKWGTGAFMATFEEAKALAESLHAVANGAGLKTHALITDMNEPLADAAGNAVEVAHAIDFLTRRVRSPRVEAVTVALGAEMLLIGGLVTTLEEAEAKLIRSLDDGSAAEVFARMVSALGGPADLLDRPQAHLKAAPVTKPVFAAASGLVEAIDTRAIGVAVVELGGGRAKAADTIDHAVGFTELVGSGDDIGPHRPLGLVHAASEAAADRAAAALRRAYMIGTEAPAMRAAIALRIGT
ncbi:thymidine phosphorylase [Methyloraptor flagellatus]|uniref:Thymidine phosphorylase n=1 Tax=Methyloraptor flagellatus TaxID=3162530 RepID=A0AAU7X6X5_9HYPH